MLVANKSPVERVAALARKAEVLRPRYLAPHAIPLHYLRSAEQALIQQTARGLYLPANAPAYRAPFAGRGCETSSTPHHLPASPS